MRCESANDRRHRWRPSVYRDAVKNAGGHHETTSDAHQRVLSRRGVHLPKTFSPKIVAGRRTGVTPATPGDASSCSPWRVIARRARHAMTAMHRLLTSEDGVDTSGHHLSKDDASYEAKKARAMAWLAKNARELDLPGNDATAGIGRPRASSKGHSGIKSTAKKSTLDDISDDEHDKHQDSTDDEYPDLPPDAPGVATAREVHKLVRLFFSTDEEKATAKENEMEGCRNALRRARTDPVIAPDEPVPLTIRPYDVTPGDKSKDTKYTYRHALTTVHEVKRELAKKLDKNIETLDLVMCGKALSDEKTLMECGVCARYVVYLRVDQRKAEMLGRRDSS